MALLEGLEAVELPLAVCKSIIDFRIDANTYKKEYLKTERILSNKQTSTVESISESIQNFGAYSLCNHINFHEEGIPFLMTKNVRINFIDWNIEKFVDLEGHKLLWKSHCKRGQVLVTMAGEYLGRVAVFNSDQEASSNQAIAKISLKAGQSPYTLSTFLNSKFGQHQIQRFKTITGQPNINMSLIGQLIVPDFSLEFCKKIEALMLEVDVVNVKGTAQYFAAETLLIETLGLINFKPSTEAVNIKSFKDSFCESGRLDAEYYQPKYEEWAKAINAYEHGHSTIAIVCEVKDKNFTPEDDKSYAYIELSDIDKVGSITGATVAAGQDLPTRARRIVKKGDVLVSSIEGSLSSCAIVSETYNDALCSTGFYVIRSSKINSETLLVLMKSTPIQALLKQGCSGTILTAINNDAFLSLLIPLVDKSTQQNIATHIQKSFKLKAESERLLEVAKRAVEIAIEQDEAIGMAYLKANGSVAT